MKKSISSGNNTKDEKDDDVLLTSEGLDRIELMFENLEDVTKISRLAHKLGYITINSLAYILASDDIYEEETLSGYWDELQINTRKKFPDDISTLEKRVGVWLSILERWTSKSIDGNRTGLKPIAGLRGYKYKYILTDEYFSDEPLSDCEFIEDKDDPDYVNLGELEKYLIETAEIPLSKLLFPEDNEQQKNIPLTAFNKEITEQKKTENFFTRDRDFWHIGFGGNNAIIKNLDGLLYISYLLEKRGESISCQELSQIVSGKIDGTMPKNAAIDEGLNVGRSLQPISDYKAKIEYRNIYLKLQNDLKQAESEMEQQEIEKEMETIIHHLKGKNFADTENKNAQANIKKRINTAFEAMRKANMKDMARHLQRYIKPDDAYGLHYIGNVNWEITIR